MSKTKVSSLILVLIIYFIISFAIIYLIIRYGCFPPAATWILPILTSIFSLILLYKGWQVKKYKDKKNDIDPIFASRIVIFAKTFSYVGACLGGFCLAQTTAFILYREALYLQNMIFIAFTGFMSCLLMSVIGMIVENWCIIDDTDDYGSNIVDTGMLSHNY